MRNKLFLVFLGLFLISFISADESGGLLTGKQFDCIQLPQECASCSYSKVTKITYPNLSMQIINTVMTKNGSSYNYSFCDTGDIGDYSYCTIADVDGTDTSACKPFTITSSGFQFTTGLYILFMILSIGLVILGFYIEDNWVIVLGGFGMVFLGLFQLFYGLGDFKDNVYTYALGIIVLMTGAYFSVRGAYEALS